ncbi:MAG TPA: hypothetical protein VGA21_10890, partial [Cyclobacteriaceae bacterium]
MIKGRFLLHFFAFTLGLLFLGVTAVFSQVTITQGTAPTICGTGTVTLSDIVIDEVNDANNEAIGGANGSGSGVTFILELNNANFSFVNGAGTATSTSGTDDVSSISLGGWTATTVTITFDFNNTGGGVNDKIDAITISGLQVNSGIAGNESYIITRQGGSVSINGLADGTQVGSGLKASVVVANAGSDVSICSGESVQIGGTPTASGGGDSPIYTYSWSPSTGLSSTTSANPNASPTSTETYTVTVTDTSTGCFDTDDITVTVTGSVPTITIAPATPNPACKGDFIDLSGSSVVGATGGVWSTSGDGGFSPNTTTVAANYQPGANDIINGSVTLTLTATGGCPGSENTVISFEATPATPTITVTLGTTTFCEDGGTTSVTLQSSAAPNGGTYLWYKNGISTGITTQDITLGTVAESGSYTVEVTDGAGALCTS